VIDGYNLAKFETDLGLEGCQSWKWLDLPHFTNLANLQTCNTRARL